MMEFTFELSPWEQALEVLNQGDEMNILRLLSLLEQEDEDAVLEALDAMEEKGVALSIRDLPSLQSSCLQHGSHSSIKKQELLF